MDMPDNYSKSLLEATHNDQRFLLNFIIGTYLGPDVKSDSPRRSASQRIAEGRPPYYFTDLGNSFLKLSDVESLYYYILRNTHPSAVLKLNSLYKYFKGQLAPPASDAPDDERQFTSFFPSTLHGQGRYKGSFKIFKGIVIIDDPDTSYIRPADLDRFKILSGLDDLKIDRNEAQLYRHGYRTDKDDPMDDFHLEMDSMGDVPNGNAAEAAKRRNSRKRRRIREIHQDSGEYFGEGKNIITPLAHVPPQETVKAPDYNAPAMVVLASANRVEQWNPKPSIHFTGTARDARLGPLVGLVDIGSCKDAYLFRVALPGVKKDHRQFSCEVECDGKVLIKGVTVTGEKNMLRHSRWFHMRTENLCPPGPFTLSFRLPGPVDPRLFYGTFGPDGILEAIVRKYEPPKSSFPQVAS
ncbi:hypothetical protein AMTRI_Chr03g44210 [Amborella trichopoda]|uniref:increased DNA methylation 3 n=1 Tax=Amborella trichopoda TaxID=13333 RepID=UPI0005D40507|nr:increased DNA methylation 3 [Amborella trichopoda]XP_011625427.1 increased DNA methylation 3 [Amborella trichopoda]|eukprot:XP_011625426.1 increased DNA methylation 3 [Amborella trichopoda]